MAIGSPWDPDVSTVEWLLTPMALRCLAFMALPAAVLGGCGDDSGWSSTACSPAAPVGGGMLERSAVQGTISNRFSLSAIGVGAGEVGRIALTDNQGQMAIRGTDLPAVAYQRTTAANYDVYQGMTIGSDRWYFWWLYCASGAMSAVWIESTRGELLTMRGALGQCNLIEAPTTTAVDFPASVVDTTYLRCGAEVDGPELSIHGGMGRYTFLGDSFTVLVIGTVDCSYCGGSGWYELHSLLWSPATGELGFAVIYLDGTPDEIRMRSGHGGAVDYWLSLPSLHYVEGNGASIDWTLTPPSP
jgi:hypothetical protein